MYRLVTFDGVKWSGDRWPAEYSDRLMADRDAEEIGKHQPCRVLNAEGIIVFDSTLDLAQEPTAAK